MARVSIQLPHHQYDITIEPGGLDSLGEVVQQVAPAARCTLVVDEQVARHHGARAQAALAQAGFEPIVHALPSGEAHKTLETVAGVYETMLSHRMDRRSPVVVLGGGVTGDIGGFAAATFLRGVPFVQCPTTLLAMVDSSVGGKTGVNVPQGKNLIGAFHQPSAVVADPELLATLPPRELSCGLAECIKHAVIRDADLFRFTEEAMTALRALDADALVELVRRNVEIKARVVEEDEKERGVRAHLNFGHTFGHAIEATVGYGEVLHGEAVGLGMLAAGRAAAEMGLWPAADVERLRALVEAAGLPTTADLPDDETLDAAMTRDKKAKDGTVVFVLPDRLGNVVLRDDVPSACVHAGWAEIRP